jgi:hypothetical protein
MTCCRRSCSLHRVNFGCGAGSWLDNLNSSALYLTSYTSSCGLAWSAVARRSKVPATRPAEIGPLANDTVQPYKNPANHGAYVQLSVRRMLLLAPRKVQRAAKRPPTCSGSIRFADHHFSNAILLSDPSNHRIHPMGLDSCFIIEHNYGHDCFFSVSRFLSGERQMLHFEPSAYPPTRATYYSNAIAAQIA